jgi:hypothetical protein
MDGFSNSPKKGVMVSVMQAPPLGSLRLLTGAFFYKRDTRISGQIVGIALGLITGQGLPVGLLAGAMIGVNFSLINSASRGSHWLYPWASRPRECSGICDWRWGMGDCEMKRLWLK